MDQKLHWVLLFYFCCFFNNCLGDGLKVKAKGTRNVLRIEFKPREKTEPHKTSVFKPKKEGKEMLYGSVVWFVPKEKEESGKSKNNSKVEDVIRLRSGNRQTYQRKNKSLDVNETVILNVKNNPDEDGQTHPRNDHVSQTERTSKSIEQNRKPNGDPALKGRIKNASEQGQKNEKAAKQGRRNLQTRKNNKNGAQNRRLNNGQTRRRNKNRRQNRKGNNENAQKKTDTKETDAKNERDNNKITKNAKKEDPEHNIQNENLRKNVQNKKEQVRTSETSSQANKQETAIIREIKSQIAEQIEDRVVQKIKEVQSTEKIKESLSTEPPSEADQTKPLTHTEKQKVVQNADLLGQLLAQSDPSLIKVLIDNSSPENLNVFLSHSNITVEELKDIIAY